MAKKKRTPFEERKRQAEKTYWFSCLFFVAIFGLVGGSVLGCTRLNLYQKAHGEPQVKSLVDLNRDGPGDNLYIKLSDFDYGSQYWSITGKDSDGKPTNQWTYAYLAAFPKGRADDATAPLIIVRTNDVDNAEEVTKFKAQASIKGILINTLQDCATEQKHILSQYHRPEANYKNVLVIDTDWTVPTVNELSIIAGVILVSLVTLVASLIRALAAYRKLKELTGPAYVLPECKKAIAPDESYQAGWQRCIMLIQAKRSSDAIEALVGLIVKFPTRAEPRALLAQILPREKQEVYLMAPPYAMYTYQPDSPLGLCREALAMAPDMPYVHFVHAVLLRQRGLYKQASKAVEEALRLDAEYSDAIIEAGLIALDQGEFEQAIKYCDMGLRLRPHEFAFLNNKALALWRQRRLAEASDLLDQALVSEPNKANAHINRGAIAKELKQNEVALEHFKIALRLNPLNQGLVEMVALAVPERPLSLRIVRLLMVIAGGPYFLGQYLYRVFPVLNKLIWKGTIQILVALYPLILLGLFLCFEPSARPVVGDCFNRCYHTAPMQGPILAFMILLGVPWLPFVCFWVLFRKMAVRVAHAELRK